MWTTDVEDNHEMSSAYLGISVHFNPVGAQMQRNITIIKDASDI